MLLCLLLIGGLVIIVFACMQGSVSLSASDVIFSLEGMVNGQEPTLATHVLKLRLDRIFSAFITGGALSLAGVMMQALLRNPLADPYILGVSGGAAVGALLAMLLFAPFWMVDVAALGGAICVSLILYILANRDLRGGVGGSNSLLLTGVILSSGSMALVTLMLSIAPDSRLRGMIFWMIGDLSFTEFHILPCIILFVGLIFAMRVARAVNVMTLYAHVAVSFGVNVARLRSGLFVFATVLTACAVTIAGSVGFVGLIIPHVCRFAIGSDHRLLMPFAMLTGGFFLVLADTIARTVLAPQQLPVGVITAMIGVPVFLLQLRYMRRS